MRAGLDRAIAMFEMIGEAKKFPELEPLAKAVFVADSILAQATRKKFEHERARRARDDADGSTFISRTFAFMAAMIRRRPYGQFTDITPRDAEGIENDHAEELARADQRKAQASFNRALEAAKEAVCAKAPPAPPSPAELLAAEVAKQRSGERVRKAVEHMNAREAADATLRARSQPRPPSRDR